ncbi:MAG: hypothetical protein RR741_07965 [Erysipelotrichaceae bacterium]
MTIRKIVLTNSKGLYANFWTLAIALVTALPTFYVLCREKRMKKRKKMHHFKGKMDSMIMRGNHGISNKVNPI